jgi:hypothetical protein
MATLFRNGQVPSQAVLEIIVAYMKRVNGPVYMGFVSLEVGWSLARTQEMLDLLEERGVIKRMSDEEKSAVSIPQCANVYVLVAQRARAS